MVAPTGSGKTLSAFLWALDRMASTPVPAEPLNRCRVLYISPLKALAVDVERNLRAPLTGIGHAAARLGLPAPEVTVGLRSGDTPAADRRSFAKTPPDVLITTPESLFLLLTSKARAALAGIETVIIDEVHSVAGNKRGAHLALSLDRLDHLLPQPAQRIGLSATVRPIDEVTRFLAGGRPVTVVEPPRTKTWDLQVVVPVPDLSALGATTDDLSGSASGEPVRSSIWPALTERLVELITRHRSTLVFVNSRRQAEQLTARINELWQDQHQPEHPTPGPVIPAQIMAAAGISAGAPGDLARAHHGSVSKEQRAQIEDELKSGRLPAVVATSSLELGIDMGSIDLVVQVAAPPSVASGLQRVGRAGHQVGAVSAGTMMPKFRGDLISTTVVVDRMRAGEIESIRVPSNPLDVLAQQVVAMCAMDDWSVAELAALCRKSAPFSQISPQVLNAVLDMLSGRYPSAEFAELRPRLTWDRGTDVLTGRRAAQRLAVTSGGTIADRGLFGVFLVGGDGPGRRVGELDEEMVYESRVGDVFTLGTSSWRIEEITHHQVLVSPAPGQPGKLPFWHGEGLGRPVELGQAIGEFIRELSTLTPTAVADRLREAGLDEWASANLRAYLNEQQEATGPVPTDETLVLERFRDELGDWRVVLHSPFGSQVHAPWALVIAARLQARFGFDVQAMAADDGIVLRIPEMDWESGESSAALGPELLELIRIPPDEVAGLVTEQVGGSALFAARFRECASRALLLPRRQPGKRQPLWQQRQRSAQLLEIASRYPDFPIVLETVRECLQDVYDVPALVDLMRSLDSRRIAIVDCESQAPSPFARSLLFGYVAQFLYEGDAPLAERRAAALALDPTLLAELLGQGDGAALRDLLDPEQLARTEAELQHLSESRRARDAEDLLDLLRILGPLRPEELPPRVREPEAIDSWISRLQAQRQVLPVRLAGLDHWAVAADFGILRDAIGVPVPLGLPAELVASIADPLAELLLRYARTHGPFTAAEVAERFGLGPAIVQAGLGRLVNTGQISRGEYRPGGTGSEFCSAQVLRIIRRRSVAALRQQVEPVPASAYVDFLAHWQSLHRPLRGSSGLLRVIEQLSGAVLPASGLESVILPQRLSDWSAAALDELLSSGEVLWCGHGGLSGNDGWVSLHLADLAPLTLAVPTEQDWAPLPAAILELLSDGGGYFYRTIAAATGARASELTAALWELVWAGLITGDTLAPLRGYLGATPRPRTPAKTVRTARYSPRPRLGRGLPQGSAAPDQPPPTAVGRWSLLPRPSTNLTERAALQAEGLLDLFGVVTRGTVAAADIPGGFAGVYRVLSAFEEAGKIRRGYFIDGLGAAQFAGPGAVDRLRQCWEVSPTAKSEPARPRLLAAADPANPFGAAIPWPPSSTEPKDRTLRPGRKAGALVVIYHGELALYLERGGKSSLTFSATPEVLAGAAQTLARAVADRTVPGLTIERNNGESLLAADSGWRTALIDAGFHLTARGVRCRR